MNKHDWPQLKALFHAALEQPEADRAAFVARAGDEHPHLAEQLRALVSSYSDAGDFLEQPAFARASLGADPEDLVAEPDPAALLSAGDVLDDTYEVEAMLGNGGMGVVYRVRHKALARSFAAKLMHSRFADDPVFVQRFAREAEALGKLTHPHIVAVTNFGVDRPGTARPYLIMEYLQGQTLQERLHTGPLESDAAIPIFEAIAAAIDHAHEQGVLHLDLKPGNVLLVDGADGVPSPRILDFGLAQFVTSESAKSNPVQPIGTPAYMAPELWDGGRPGRSADIYSFGVLMYEALTGRRPFEGSAPEIRHQNGATAAPASSLNPAIGRDVDSALTTALATNPSARPATARAAVALVRRAALVARQQRWRRTEVPRRLAAATGIAVVLTLLSPLLDRSSLLHQLEGQTVDGRFALAPQRPPGSDVLLLLYDDASLKEDRTLLDRADQIGVDLQRVLDSGARAVALDLILPESWSQSGPFYLFVLRNPDRLTLAAQSTPDGEVLGPQGIKGVTTVELGPERASALFGFVNLDTDDDGINRRARLSYRDRQGGTRPSFAAHAASTAGLVKRGDASVAGPERFWIDHTVDNRRFDRVSWKDLDATLRTRPELFRNRLVLAGVDYAASGDDARIPGGAVIAGVVLHALTVETIASGFPVKGVGAAATMVAIGIACGLLCAATLLIRSLSRAVLGVILLGATYAAGAVMMFRLSHVLLPLVAPLVLCGLGAALAVWIRRRLPPFPLA